VLTNLDARPKRQVTNASGSPVERAGRDGVSGSNHARGERPVFHTVYVLSGAGGDAKLQAVQIKTGISDGISTEVLSGLDEGAQVVTGVVNRHPRPPATANPFGGGFPRMR
jgi:multidrug efflux pump subunit AcrA (membrane-fusion protein)